MDELSQPHFSDKVINGDTDNKQDQKDEFIVKVRVYLNSSPQLASTLQLRSSNNELLCSCVFTLKVKVQLNSSPQPASTLQLRSSNNELLCSDVFNVNV